MKFLRSNRRGARFLLARTKKRISPRWKRTERESDKRTMNTMFLQRWKMKFDEYLYAGIVKKRRNNRWYEREWYVIVTEVRPSADRGTWRWSRVRHRADDKKMARKAAGARSKFVLQIRGTVLPGGDRPCVENVENRLIVPRGRHDASLESARSYWH